jgi:adenine-specific DNA-methyltransferase
MPIQKLNPIQQLTEDRLKELAKVVPEAFADGKVNWQSLKLALGETLEDTERTNEHFGLYWPGKQEAKRFTNVPSTGTLIPVKGEGVNEETTENIFIEGENLEVLKILRKSYTGKIKMIYIDPPYNTGNDFIYDDNFTEPLQDYLRRTGQVDGEGKPLTTNKKTDGRFHSKWLSMMYPRLRLARELLKEDGVIFISIDDNEVANLKLICDEIFGSENFVGKLCWKNKYGAGAKTRGFIEVHEYILCFSKNKILNIESELTDEQIKEYDKKRDENYAKLGGYITQPLMTKSLDDRINLTYKINYQGEEIIPRKQWVWEESKLLQAISKNHVVFNRKPNGEWSVRNKVYLKDEHGNIRKGKPITILNGPFNQEGTEEVENLIGRDIFDFPKPKRLISYLLNFTINNQEDDNFIILDFFSGSGTTADSVLERNGKDLSNIKFICVQIPELNYSMEKGIKKPKKGAEKAFSNGYETISDIAKKRIKEATNKYIERYKQANLGFKVFKLSPSNFKSWEDYRGDNLKEIEDLFKNQTGLAKDWKKNKEGLISEILLLEGFPLHSKITKTKTYPDNTIWEISCDFHENKLLICLDEKLDKTTVSSLKIPENTVFICLDSAIDNSLKSTLGDKGLVKTI